MRRLKRKSEDSKTRPRRRRAATPKRRRWHLKLALPRWAWPGAAATLLVALVGGSVIAGWPQALVRGGGDTFIEISRQAGLTLAEITVVGRDHTRSADLLTAVGAKRGDAMLRLDPDAIRTRLESLPWVESATVERRLPGQLFLAIKERVPVAIWRRPDGDLLIDRAGVAIDRNSDEFRLPVLAGEDAPLQAAALIDLLAAEPSIGGRVVGAAWVGGRRWNLRLDNGIELRLPAENPGAALTTLAEIERRHRLSERDVLSVDLRLPDRAILRLSPAALQRRAAPANET